MKVLKNALQLFLLTIIVLSACQGPEGPIGPKGDTGVQGPKGDTGVQGPKGDPGNANVQVFDLTVTAAEWGTNLHYGDNNIYRAYSIQPSQVGEVDISDFFLNEDGVVLVYAQIVRSQGYRQWKSLPYSYSQGSGSNIIGVKIEFLIAREDLVISKTNSGWDSKSISVDDLPETVNFRIVLIESFSLENGRISDEPLDYNDYRAVRAYYNLQD